MVSFQNWNETAKEGILATKDSFATQHPIITIVLMIVLFCALFAFWAWQLNRIEKDEEQK